MLEDLYEPTERCKSQTERNCERNIPFDGEISFVTASHALAVRDILSSTNDGEFAPPDRLRESKKGPVDVGPGVPVSGDQKHLLADIYPGLVNLARRTGPGIFTLHVNVS